jgi:hypothetical protein
MVALMPPVVLGWIGASVIRQGSWGDACRYAALSPALPGRLFDDPARPAPMGTRGPRMEPEKQ